MINTSTKPVIEAIQNNEQLFRNILRDAISREIFIPRNINPDDSLEKLLKYVPHDTRIQVPGQFKIDMFSVGPSEQLFAGELQNNQAAFGYSNIGFLSGGGAILLYEVLKDNEVKYLKDIMSIIS